MEVTFLQNIKTEADKKKYEAMIIKEKNVCAIRLFGSHYRIIYLSIQIHIICNES